MYSSELFSQWYFSGQELVAWGCWIWLFGLLEGVPAHERGTEIGWSFKPLSIETILWFLCSMK